MLPEQTNHFSYLDSLNPAQRLAVETLDGPVLVLAGAGTGKTRVLTTRLGHLLTTGRAGPAQILAVTFTNKAAAEMKHRVSSMLGGRPVEGWWLGTFHSLCARMLRRHAERVGLKTNFTILDEDDQLRLIKQLAEAENIDAKKCPPRLLLSVISRWKDRAQTPEQITQADGGDIADGKLPRLYALYQERLRILNACDFGDLLMHCVSILRDPKNADVLQDYQNRFKYILVDEYQDTNVAQYMWLRLLAQTRKNICCVGDDDQSIYGWRGAEIGNILRFEQDFPGATVVRLEQNYRSTKNILAAANGVIAHNRGRLGKELWSADEDGEPVHLRGVWDGAQEAQTIAGDIESLQRKGVKLGSMAILVRAGFQTREFEERFIRESIPYRVIGGLRFYERQEIRDAIAYMRVTVQPDDDLALQRIINVPKRGIGDATMQVLHSYARAQNISLFGALRRLLETDEFKPKVKQTLTSLVGDFDRWRLQLRELTQAELAGIILDESGYTGMWQADKSPEAAGRLENLKEFVAALEEFESMESFLEHVALVMENQEQQGADMVSVMTLHSAKGLEFDVVFLPGWEEGVFPSQRTMDENGIAGLEEERRLAYVGITRARKRATISFAANRVIYGSWTSCLPSRFIDELPKEHIDTVVETGLSPQSGGFGGGYGGGNYGGGGFGGGGASGFRGRRAELADSGISQVSPHLESEGGFAPGDRVFHQKFGPGTVVSTDRDKLDIKFDKAGRKKIMDSFVTKEKN
ncbi:MAG TPA: UvrD-helicase domain-containing protein [Alphaproteobacteria bacterium]|nr:DNA helicase II [Rhodospirillaceae bacterium]HRJ66700.1 UvrD-helicase domain-containing protein [Alphaproteobacteria bacterium]